MLTNNPEWLQRSGRMGTGTDLRLDQFLEDFSSKILRFVSPDVCRDLAPSLLPGLVPEAPVSSGKGKTLSLASLHPALQRCIPAVDWPILAC